VAEPLPLPPLEECIQLWDGEATHEQPALVETVTLELPPAALNDPLEGESVYAQEPEPDPEKLYS
jgi:hypothetical protein